MAKYKITNIDEVKGHVTFQVLDGAKVILTDTRCDLPIDDKEAVDVELSRFANEVVGSTKESLKTDTALTEIVGVAQTAKEA